MLRSRTSLHKIVTRTLNDDRLREVALHQSRLAGHEPRSVPAWMGLWAYVAQNDKPAGQLQVTAANVALSLRFNPATSQRPDRTPAGDDPWADMADRDLEHAF